MGLSKDDSSATVHHSTNREADPSAPAHSVVVPVRARTAAASTTPKTAGFFSTFSLDLPGKTSTSNTAAGDGKHILHLGTTDVVTDSLGAAPAQYAVRRRNRRVFVCLPCHGRKLRCDRRKPACGRCVAAGLGDSCTYEKASGERSRADEGVVKGDGRRRHASGSGSGPAATLADRETVSPSIEGHGVGADERRYPDGGDDIGSDVEDDDDSDDAVDAWEMSCYKKSEGRARVSKTSHWAMISAEFEEAVPYLFGKHPGWAARFESLKALKWMFPTLKTGNFPFGSAAASCCPRADKRQIIAGLPPRAIVELLVHGYLSTVERTHRLLHGPQFLWQLDRFFADPMAVPDGWLAMLLMMMAIACRVAPLPSQEVASEMLRAEWQRWKEDQEPVQGLGSCGPHSSLASGAAVDTATHSPHRVDLRSMAIHQWTDRFLDDAEACLARSPWLTAPDITTVQTLAMMALARQLELVTHNDTFQCYVVLGLAVRVATALQFHRSASRLFPGMPKFEAEMRSRVWTTIVLLDLDVALASGMSSVPYDYDADPPMNVNDSEIAPDGLPSSLDIGGRIEMHVPRGSPPPERGPIRRRRPAGVAQSTSSASVDKDDASRADSGLQSSSTQQQGQGASSRYTEGTFQSLLAPLLRRAAAVVNAVNSVRAAHAVPYSRVMAWDAELRSLLVDAALAFNMRYGDLPGIDQTEQHAGCRIGFGTVCTRTRCERVAAQLGIFEVLVRRTLLALHHPYARSRSTTTTEREMTTKRAKRYARSRAAVLESSMALLAVQQLWSEAATSAMMGIGGSGTSTMADNSRVGWLLDLCKDDFKTAMIYVILGLRRSEFPCDDNAAVSLNPGAASPQSPPSASPSATSSTSWPSSSSSVVVSARDSARNAASTRATSLASSPAANGTSSAASASASFARHQTGRSTRATTEGIMERSTKQGEDQQKTNPLSTLPTVSAARAALASGISIMRRRACRSFTHFREYTGVSILLQVLACVEEEREERQNSRLGNELQNQETAQVQRGPGCCVPSCTSFARLLPSDETRVLPAMLALADEIEAVVVQGRKGLWDAAAPVPAADTSLSPQPLPAEMMMGSCGGLSDEPAQMHNLFGRQLEQEQQQPDATWLSDSNMMVIDDDFFEYLF